MFSLFKKIKQYISDNMSFADSKKQDVQKISNDFRDVVDDSNSFFKDLRTRTNLGGKIESFSKFIDKASKPVTSFFDSLDSLIEKPPGLLATVVLAGDAVSYYVNSNTNYSTKTVANTPKRSNQVSYSTIDQKVSENYANNYLGKFKSDLKTFTNKDATSKKDSSNYFVKVAEILSGDAKQTVNGKSKRAWSWEDREQLLYDLVDKAPDDVDSGYDKAELLIKIIKNNSYLSKKHKQLSKRVLNNLKGIKKQYKT